MNEIYIIRLKLGLSQSSFAKLLGLSQSMIALVETGKRSLPSFVWDRLRAIQRRINGSSTTTNDTTLDELIQKLRTQLVQKLDRQIAALEKKNTGLQKKLERMKKKFEDANPAMQLISEEKHIYRNTVNHKKSVDKIFDQVAVTFLEVCLEQQQMLELEIVCVEHELSLRREKRAEWCY